MENGVSRKPARRWVPGGILILVLLIFGFGPVHAYYICVQSDGSQLITDTPGPNCVNQEKPGGPGLNSGKKPKESGESPNLPGSEETSRELLDFEGHNREWWRSRIRDLKQERNDLSLQILDAKKRLNSVSPDMWGHKRRKRKIRKEIDGLNEMFQAVDHKIEQELPEEARKAGVPPGWIRE